MLPGDVFITYPYLNYANSCMRILIGNLHVPFDKFTVVPFDKIACRSWNCEVKQLNKENSSKIIFAKEENTQNN